MSTENRERNNGRSTRERNYQRSKDSRDINRRAKGAAGSVKSTGYRRRSAAQRQRDLMVRRMLVTGIGIFIIVFAVAGYRLFFGGTQPASREVPSAKSETVVDDDANNPVPMPEIDVQLLTPNEYSRPGIPIEKVNGIVVHYLANPMTSAQNNRDYFESLKDLKNDYLSSNFIIGLDGEIVQCVPSAEVAYASNGRNDDTISIENCHPDETGKFNDTTYNSLVKLVAYLCGKYELNTDQIIRHYDVTGKICPKYYVDNEDKWEEFKQDVGTYMEECENQ